MVVNITSKQIQALISRTVSDTTPIDWYRSIAQPGNTCSYKQGFSSRHGHIRAYNFISKKAPIVYEEELPRFTLQGWSRLEQIHTVLHKFNELTLFISKRNPQITLTVSIYYELHELLDDVREGNGDFAKLDRDIIAAVKEGMKKYEKYYSIMDDCDTYYTALVLDPRVKGEMVLRELQDGDAGTMILDTIRTNLHQVYAASSPEPDAAESQSSSLKHSDVESRMLKKLQARDPPLSDIGKYFDTPPISVADTTGQNWLCNWWKMHKGEYPRMAAAARDYLASPASEVAVERVFSTARDVLGIRR
ncbi:hypothetical protein PENANT_c134G04431 [Penicillium antarcticum]|uniref:HAT C-terminal dimerisation domain-containing protein n=2 Tax=Penicillium antarcticum TaxID=416450 RepID=A0A1V6PGQ8_9EURO|nr:hypothetical protein PENANT_c134G04431 [Penicillium antarcticum]